MTGWAAGFRERRMPARLALALTVTLGILAVAATIATAALQATTPGSFPPLDYDVFGPPGADILLGRWDQVFRDPSLQAGPFELLFFGVPSLLGVDGVVGWAVTASVLGLLLLAGFVAVLGVALRGLSPDLTGPIVTGVAAFAVLTATFSATIVVGHPAQVVVPLLGVLAAVLARRGWAVSAGAVLGAAVGWELWAVLAVPVLLLLPRIRVREVLLAALGGVAALAIVFGGFLLAGPVEMFGHVWPVADVSLVHVLFPDATTFDWPMRLGQAVVAVAGGVAAAVALRGRRDAVWLVPLAVVAIRLLADPVLYDYYFRAPAVLALVGLGFAIAQRSPWRVAAGFVLVSLSLGMARFGWVGAAVLVAAVAVVVILVARLPEPRPLGSSPVGAPAPVAPIA